uniref:DCL1 n=1 Tax=Arundo donax TaxID=35708 RepID=A0A0A9H4S6_ARUDO
MVAAASMRRRRTGMTRARTGPRCCAASTSPRPLTSTRASYPRSTVAPTTASSLRSIGYSRALTPRAPPRRRLRLHLHLHLWLRRRSSRSCSGWLRLRSTMPSLWWTRRSGARAWRRGRSPGGSRRSPRPMVAARSGGTGSASVSLRVVPGDNGRTGDGVRCPRRRPPHVGGRTGVGGGSSRDIANATATVTRVVITTGARPGVSGSVTAVARWCSAMAYGRLMRTARESVPGRRMEVLWRIRQRRIGRGPRRRRSLSLRSKRDSTNSRCLSKQRAGTQLLSSKLAQGRLSLLCCSSRACVTKCSRITRKCLLFSWCLRCLLCISKLK